MPILFMMSCLRVMRRLFADPPVIRPKRTRGGTTTRNPNIGITAIPDRSEAPSSAELHIISAVTPMIRKIATQTAIPRIKAVGIFFVLACVCAPP